MTDSTTTVGICGRCGEFLRYGDEPNDQEWPIPLTGLTLILRRWVTVGRCGCKQQSETQRIYEQIHDAAVQKGYEEGYHDGSQS